MENEFDHTDGTQSYILILLGATVFAVRDFGEGESLGFSEVATEGSNGSRESRGEGTLNVLGGLCIYSTLFLVNDLLFKHVKHIEVAS